MNARNERKSSLRQRRSFSEAVKKQIVHDIEKGKASILEASREIGAHQSTIYTWIYRYSRYLTKNKVMVIEDKSESYRTKDLEKRLKEAEAALGRKQMEIDFLNKIIDLANDEYRTDLKKSLVNPPSVGSNPPKGKNTGTK